MSGGRIKALLELCRAGNLPTVWTNVLAAVLLSGAPFSWSSFLVLAVALSFLYSAGTCLNDLLDIEADRADKGGRPLPSGRISKRAAWVSTILLFVLGLAPLLLLVPNPRAFFCGLLLMALVLSYDLVHKISVLSVTLMATCRFMIFPVAAVAVSGEVKGGVIAAGLAQGGYVLALSLAARFEGRLSGGFSWPVIPVMLAGICLVDAAVLLLLAPGLWFLAGLAGALLTLLGQALIKGD